MVGIKKICIGNRKRKIEQKHKNIVRPKQSFGGIEIRPKGYRAEEREDENLFYIICTVRE